MGINMSFIGIPGLRGKQSSTHELFNHVSSREIYTFEDFHIAFLDCCTKLNSALPGVHYNAPPLESLKECYDEWIDPSKDADEKKQLVIELVEKHVSISRADNNAILVTGLVAPAAAMLLKRAVPDVFFVSSCTLLAIATAKAMQIYMARKIP